MDAAGEAVVGDLALSEGKGERIVVDGDDVAVPQAGSGDREDGRPASHVEDGARRRLKGGKGLQAPRGARVLAGPETGPGPHADEVGGRLRRIIAVDDYEGSDDEWRKRTDVLGDPVLLRQFVEGRQKTEMCLDVPARAFGLLAAGEEGLDGSAEEGEGQGLELVEKVVCARVLRLELPGHVGVTKAAMIFLRPALSKAMSSFSPSALRTRP